MVVESATLEEALASGIDLGTNAFMLIHGWTACPLLMQFAAKCVKPLEQGGKTAEQLAKDADLKVGPLAIALRTCSVLGYLNFEPSTGEYTLKKGSEFNELMAFLGPEAATTQVLNKIYADAAPPFRLPSAQASLCLGVWAEQRPQWQNSKSKALSILLDGVVLAPLLTSIAYFARWDEAGLDSGKDSMTEYLDFTQMDAAARETLGGIVNELNIGTMNSSGTAVLTSKGLLALQRCYSYFVPTSYSPLLSRFKHALTEDPSWGFVDMGQDTGEAEEHVKRVLNVVGSGAQHKTLFKDLMRHIHDIFDTEEFEAQPKFVVDTGSGDGHLLMHIYEHVKGHTMRGQKLDDFPLTMVGVDFNEESRVATAVNLSAKNIPHKVIAGDIGKPSGIMAMLKRKKVDPKKSLHVRSFLDHDRPYIAPSKTPEEGSVTARYAKGEMADVVHLDKHGNPISAVEVFASLVEHFERWGDALEGSHGLCLLEVMMLDVPTTKRFFNDCVSFHFDIVQCLSRQYMISPPAFAMGAAMAGLLPAKYKQVQTYPEQGKYCRVMGQRLARRPFKIRFAVTADIDELVRLEELAWSDANLGASREVLLKRLETSPTTVLVCEMNNKVAAVLYMQLVSSVDVIDSEVFMDISKAHDPEGRIIQLIAIGSDPEHRNLSIGTELRNFALHLARVDPKVDSVIGVTRCHGFQGTPEELQAYVDAHVAGKNQDRTLNFHTSYGAEVGRLVPNFRPEDKANHGTGVFIQYHVKDFVSKSWVSKQAKKEEAVVPAQKVLPTASTLDVISGVMKELGHTLDQSDLTKGFINYGIDSLELVRIKNKLSKELAMELPSTFLLDFPNVSDLKSELNKRRGTKGGPSVVSSAKPTLEVVSGVMKELGHTLDQNDLTKGFINYGLDSLELVRVKNKLSKELAMELPSTFLLDFPNVSDLKSELDKRRGTKDVSSAKPTLEVISGVMKELGHTLDQSDLTKGFINYGLDSLELVRVKNKLSKELAMELPSTFLLDFPNVSDLKNELNKRRGSTQQGLSATAAVPTLVVISGIMRELGHEVNQSDLTKGFINYGLDSLELVRVKNKLSKELAMELPNTLLLDFPNVSDLVNELDRRCGSSAKGRPQAPQAQSAWDKISVEEFVQVLEKCNKKFALPQYQNKFSDLLEKHKPDKAKYLSAIEQILIEVEGSVMVAFDLIEDQASGTVQQSRKHMAACLKKYAKIKNVSERHEEMNRLTRLDADCWS